MKYIPSSLYDEGIAKNNRPHLNVDETFTVPRDALSAKKLKWKRFIITIKKNKSIRVSFYIMFNHFRLINMLLRLIDDRSSISLTDKSPNVCIFRSNCKV